MTPVSSLDHRRRWHVAKRLAEEAQHDYAVIDAGMTKSSKFAHDPALGAHLPTPHPDELLADIEALETWRKSVETRKDAIRARRS